MFEKETIETVQEGLLLLTERAEFTELTKLEQRAVHYSNALYVILAKLLKCGDNCKDKDGKQEEPSELGGLFHQLAALADTGKLGQALTGSNAQYLKQVFGEVAEVGLAAAGLRKKDAALFLSSSADTDLLLDKQREIDEAARKKDRR